ncbi:MAG TPA: hypothetical protein VMD02_04305, partial [Candidatus Omnitrophota bacterium]|nr:hypothetical protein [Candidatus Omnitrophota bacterium]
YINGGYEIALMLGLYFFVYAILSRYYLSIQRTFNLGELLFLSVFLSILDLIFVTSFVYFTGAAESPYFVLYLLNLATIAIEFPFFPQALFIWSFCATAGYDVMIFMNLMARPIFPGFTPGSERAWPVVFRLSLINGIGVPVMFFFFSGVAYYIIAIMRRLRKRLDRMTVNEVGSQEEIAALSNISWITTKINDLDNMLERVLEQTFKVLRVSSGAALLYSQRGKCSTKISKNAPASIMDYICSRDPEAKISEKDPAFKKLMEQEKINEFFIKPIVTPRGKKIGKLVFFSRTNEEFSKRGLFLLDSIVNELSVSLAYALMYERTPGLPKKGKK